MKVVVIGAGEVGYDVARMLAMEQHDVTVVDVDPAPLEAVREKLDVMTVQGSATSVDVLNQAKTRSADMLIAVTAVDEVNIISCMLANRLGVKTTVARVRTDAITNRRSVLQASDFGIDLVINPEESAAAEVTRLIRRASATDILTFAGGRLNLVGMRLEPTSASVGRTLRDIALEGHAYTFRIMAIGRGMRTILPRGDEKLRGNDQVFVLAEPRDVPHVARL
ncbi:MAG TPA: NAD-binding protein, partial [Rhodothermales bacterium]